MDKLLGGSADAGWVALKALLLYLTAVFLFRIGRRRTLAEMSPFDFVAAIAAGAVVGRVPNSSTTSYLNGAITLVTILAAHAVIMWLRHYPRVAKLFDHPPRLLVARGKVLETELHRAGLTRNDLHGLLRQNGITDLSEIAFVIFEQRGHISIVRSKPPGAAEGNLVHEIVAQAKKDGEAEE